jgi:hypothetical protein
MFGINLLIIPDTFMSVFGCPLDEHGVLVARVSGSALVGMSLLYFMLRNSALDDVATKAIIWLSLIFNAFDIPIMTIATLNGVMNQLGWLPVFVNIIIFLSSGFLLLKIYKQK